MKIEMTSKDGVTLFTAGKYCTENIEVTPTFNTSGGGGGSAEIITKYAYSGGTAVPNTGTIENIYWNTSLTMEEINTIIQNANLTYVDFEGLPVYGAYALFNTNGTLLSLVGIVDLSVMIGGLPAYFAMDMVSNELLFCTSDLLAVEMGIPVGWDANLVANSGETSIGGILISSLADMGFPSIGAENGKLISLVFTNPTKEIAESIPLTGAYDGAKLTLTSNGETDIKQLIENDKHIPLSIVVEMPNMLVQRIQDDLTIVTAKDIAGASLISSYAFAGCFNLTSIEIPNTVTFISNQAFEGCYAEIKWEENPAVETIGQNAFAKYYGNSIEIPTSVTEIRGYAFESCSNLTSITIPEGVTSIELFTFSNCSSLVSINIPDSVASIGMHAFDHCVSLTSINIPDGVTTIKTATFRDCSSLASIEIPNSVTSIGGGAFSSCSSLASIEIPNSVTSIEYDAFQNCSSLTNINIPDGVTSIGDGAFSNCSSLASIEIPNSVTSIGNSAFFSCRALTSVTIPASVTKIELDTFRGCTSLASAIIPNSVTSIGTYAFGNCSALANISFNGTVAQWNAITKGDNWKYKVPATKVVCTDGEVTL